MSRGSEGVTYGAGDRDRDVLAGDMGVARRNVAGFVRQLALVSLQVLGLWGLNFAGVWLVARSALPIPGNLVGIVALYALLAVGIVKLTWFEAAGSFLVKHLAFFFVPITVGLMNAGALIAMHGIAIILILAASAGIGILLAGGVSQCLLRKSSHMGGRT